MVLDFFTFYAEANIICVLVLSVLLIHDQINNTVQETQLWFNRTIGAHILYFLSDCIWAAIISGELPRTRWSVALVNLSNFILLSLMALEWFMYMAASEKMAFIKSREKRYLWMLPMIITTLIMLIAYAVKPYFWINEATDLNRLYYVLMIAAPMFYLVTAFIISMINAGKAESRDEKRLYMMIGIYPLGVLAFGLIQAIGLDVPIFCVGCTIMLLSFYIQHMQMMISLDALTRMNNRGQINRFMDQMTYRENEKIFIMMIDVDGFKQINDTYGHAEGDRALVLVSEALKQTSNKLKAGVFLGRYGGDEFTAILINPDENEYPEHAAKVIRSCIADKCRGSHLPYELQVSIGYDMLRDKNDTMHDCMIRADENLYKDKQARGTGR